MTNPDISPVGFAATDHPRSPLERDRSVLWIVLGVVLVVGGILGIGYFIKEMSAGASGAKDDAVAQGQIAGLDAMPTPAAEFYVEVAGPYTVWLDDGGVIDSGARDNIVAGANCVATFGDGTRSTFRGAIQGSSVQVGNMNTVGTFDAPVGAAEVACHSERHGRRADRDQLRKERTFYVTPGSPGGGWMSWVGLFAGIPAVLLGLMAIVRGWTGGVRTRKRRTRGSVAPHEW